MQKLRIVYMGTPDFAVESLKALVENGFNIVGVITVPDKPSGRGQQVSESPVKQYAVSQGLKVLQPPRLKDPQFIEELRALNADLQVIVAFRMLPEVVWSMPPLGSVNLHGSLLPKNPHFGKYLLSLALERKYVEQYNLQSEHKLEMKAHQFILSNRL